MNRCDDCGAELSALLDGEVDPQALLSALDHLTCCASCRAFYRQARALGGTLALAREQAGSATIEPPPPPGVWRRIEASVGPSWWRAFGRRPAWAAAAALALALTLGWIGNGGVPRTGEAPAEVAEVRLGGSAGEMTDERFFALTIEVLESDRRYRDALSQVLADVERYAGEGEGSTEDRSGGSEGRPGPHV